jgi:hypothetical protein
MWSTPTTRVRDAEGAAGERSLRLHFAVVGTTLRLVRRRVVRMRSLPSQPIQLSAAAQRNGLCGHWIELRDGNGQILYRQVLHDPLRTSAELLGDDGTWSRVDVPRPRQSFSVVVPMLDAARALVLVGSPPGDPGGRAGDLASFDLMHRQDANG